jgi:site-specific DNA recombinase
MIAAIYARKSTEQNGVADDAKSVIRQIEGARAYAARKGWGIAEDHIYIDDGVSGAEFERRPGFLRPMNVLKSQPGFQILIMSEESRLGREQIETAYAIKQLVKAGVRLFYYLDDRERTLDSPTDKLLLSVSTFADEIEREKARQRTYDAMARKAQAGHVTGGRVFGYENVPVNGHKERRIIEAEAAVVRRIFELAAAGYGSRRIALRLNDEGAPTPRAQQGRPDGWAMTSVRYVLYNSLYRGLILWNRSRKRDRWGQLHPTRREKTEWVEIPAPRLRIVSDDLWERAHARLQTTRKNYLRSTGGQLWGCPVSGVASKHLLAGIARCSCGDSLTVRSRPSGPQRQFVYMCVANRHRGPKVCDNNIPLPMRPAHDEVLARSSGICSMSTCYARRFADCAHGSSPPMDPRPGAPASRRAGVSLSAGVRGSLRRLPREVRSRRSWANFRNWNGSGPRSRPSWLCSPGWPTSRASIGRESRRHSASDSANGKNSSTESPRSQGRCSESSSTAGSSSRPDMTPRERTMNSKGMAGSCR